MDSADHTHLWTLWQLLDSAFPTGGFAHSGGVEAAWQHGLIRGGPELLDFTRAALRQTASGAAPVVLAVLASPGDFAGIDAFYHANLTQHVANRASRAQGRALLATASATFGHADLRTAADRVRTDRLAGHLPTAFGLTTAALGLSAQSAASAFLFATGRGMLSAAVRLGIVGPLEGQRLQAQLSSEAASLTDAALRRQVAEISQTAPVLDLLQASQDRLYSRLFQS